MFQKPDRKGGLPQEADSFFRSPTVREGYHKRPSLTVGLLILLSRCPFHLKMRAGFAGAHES
jgi:hypothetical protein